MLPNIRVQHRGQVAACSCLREWEIAVQRQYHRTLRPGSLRGRIAELIDWLDRYWDDPELRSGFWRSGW
jgi:hypothetical protein